MDSEPFGSSLIVFVVYHQLHPAQDTVILAVSLAAVRNKPHADSLHLVFQATCLKLSQRYN